MPVTGASQSMVIKDTPRPTAPVFRGSSSVAIKNKLIVRPSNPESYARTEGIETPQNLLFSSKKSCFKSFFFISCSSIKFFLLSKSYLKASAFSSKVVTAVSFSLESTVERTLIFSL